jgi:hypothetical protein
MESDDIKYILNMIISAVDLDKLDDEDIEDIAEKFERDEEQGAEEGGEDNFGGEELGGEELPAEEPVASDEELGEEENPMDALENFINSSIDEEEYTDFDEEDLSGLGEEEDMYELNIADYADLDEEAIDDSMFDYKPDFVSPELSRNDVDMDNNDDLHPTFDGDNQFAGMSKPMGDMEDDEMTEEEVEIDLDEIKNEINNNIHTTLSKYFK